MYDIPRFFLHVKHIRDDCFSFGKCESDVTGAEWTGGLGPPHNFFG